MHVVDEVGVVGYVGGGIFVCAEVDGFAVEPGEEGFPDGFHGRDGVWMADVEHAEISEAEFRSPLHDGEGMPGGFYLRDDSDTATGALALDVIELAARVGFVGSFVEPRYGGIVGPGPECCVEVHGFLGGVEVDVVVEIVAEVEVEDVLLEERQVRAHFDQKVGWVVVTSGIELIG